MVPDALDLVKQDKIVLLGKDCVIAKLTLESHPGQALVLSEKKDLHDDREALWAEIGPESKALNVLIV